MILDTMFNTNDHESMTIDAPMSSHTSPVFSMFHQPPTNIAEDAGIPVSGYLPFVGTYSNHNPAISSANNNLAPFPLDNFATLVPSDGASCNGVFNCQYDGIPAAVHILPPSHCQSVGSSDPWWSGVSVNKVNNYPSSENRFVYNYCTSGGNDLSLTLSSSSRPQLHPIPMINSCFNAPSDHQFSELSCSAVTQVSEFSVDGRNNSDHSRLSSSPVYLNHVLVGSRYLHAAQQILSQAVSFSLGDSDELDCQILKQETNDRRLLNTINSDQSSSSQSCKDPMHPSKTELLSILKLVCLI